MKSRIFQYFNFETVFTALALLILRILHMLPYRLRMAMGKGIGRLMYKAGGRRVKIARINLSLCFPDMPEEEREQVVQKVFENFGAGVFETAMSWWTPEEEVHAMTEVQGIEVMQQALAKGKGVILLGAHFTVLDLCGVLIGKVFPVIAIYREQTNALFNSMILKARTRFMAELIPHKNLISAVKRIKQGKIVWYAPDQDMGEENSVFVPFFGHPAATLTSTAKLAKLTGAEVVMLSAFRKDDDSGYVLRFTPGPVDYPGQDEKENAQKVNQVIEQAICYDIGQYAWFHRRFKSQPDMEKGAIYE